MNTNITFVQVVFNEKLNQIPWNQHFHDCTHLLSRNIFGFCLKTSILEYHSHCGKIYSHKKYFVKSTLVTSSVKSSISRNFCQKVWRVNFCNFHTVERWWWILNAFRQCCHVDQFENIPDFINTTKKCLYLALETFWDLWVGTITMIF